MKELDEKIEKEQFKKFIADIGAGDGKQTYRLARNNPKNSYVAIEPNLQSYRQIEQKSKFKKEKGGLNNLIFINSSIENIPAEFQNTFDEIQINFPWGSLLEGIIVPLPEVLENIVRIAKDKAHLIIYTTYDDKFEKSFRLERQLPELTLEYIDNYLSKEFNKLGISIINSELMADSSKLKIDSPWGKKLLSKRDREVYLIECRIDKK